jgi:DnaK suppressor protein
MLIKMKTFDEKTLKALKASLLARESELIGEIGEARESDISAADAIGIAATDIKDFKDQASSQERTTLIYAEVQRDRRELKNILAAMARLKDGSYGICIDCVKPIDLKRLTAIPEAARCVMCQTQFELRADALK